MTNISSYDKRIYRIIKLLEDISHNKRQGKSYKFSGDISLCQVFCTCHFVIAFLIFITACSS